MNEYQLMVERLFKVNPSKGFMAHHATTGIAGESGELRAATGFKNAVEEIGDMHFYSTALGQVLTHRPGGIELTSEVTESVYALPTYTNVMDNIHIVGCELLDLTKKSWIYERDLPEYQIWQQLELLRINMDFFITEVLHTSWAYVEAENTFKLTKRYPSGTYSNEQAIARKDKE